MILVRVEDEDKVLEEQPEDAEAATKLQSESVPCVRAKDELTTGENNFLKLLRYLANGLPDELDRLGTVEIQSSWIRESSQALVVPISSLCGNISTADSAKDLILAVNSRLSEMEDPYLKFTCGYSAVRDQLVTALDDDFKKVILDQSRTVLGTSGGAIGTIIVGPVQRMMRYKMMIDNIVDKCAVPDDAEIKAAISQIKIFQGTLNRKYGEIEDRKKVTELASVYDQYGATQLLQATKKIIMRKKMEKHTHKKFRGWFWKERQLILTDTHILLVGGKDKFKAFDLKQVKKELLKYMNLAEDGNLPSLNDVRTALLKGMSVEDDWNEKMFFELPVLKENTQKVYKLRNPTDIRGRRKLIIEDWVKLIYEALPKP